MLSVSAQTKFDGQVELLELDDNTATFRAEGVAEKKKEVIEVAKMAVFRKLFYTGVEGFNDDKQLVERKNKYWLDNFFAGEERAPYNAFVKGAQLDGDIDRLPTGEYHGYANVIVNTEFLIRMMETNGVIGTEKAAEPVKSDSSGKPRGGFRPLKEKE